MNSRMIAGWIALVAGLLLVVGIVGSLVIGPPAFGNAPSNGYWAMGPEMMGAGHMGSGMMGFGDAGPTATAIPSAPEVRVQAENFRFTPSEIRLPKNAEVNLTLTNPAGVAHDFTVPALGLHIVANAGETRTAGLRGLAAGRYDAYCSVPGHADLGMRAVVVVE